ncbi:ABC transporter permease [Paenibacillus sp. SYP-B3998]|uniref:ABC transporter permease n=1 Tax=Paenibacillus sp. SYP-B3998 TaxID=2678564 RepID=A0A6G4A394_9BACL|nr:ABC transporter permease [Paenibacillus sp. SYP-B3998]NEW08966.1 ABC transporter permease [Paenibacillus sp. SYP-B3998]
MTFPQFAYRNVTRNMRAYAAFYLSSTLAVMIFFMFAMFIFHPGLGNGYLNDIAKKGMVTAEWMIFCFSIFFVVYSGSAFLRTRKKELGILTIQGITPLQLRSLITLENLFIGIAAIVTGILGGLVFSKLFFTVGSYVLEMKPLPLYVPWRALGLTTGVFIPLFLLFSQFILFTIRKGAAIALLKGSPVPKKEPKPSILLSLTGSAFLTFGYGLAMFADIHFRAAVLILLCTVVGTYFFYSQISLWLLKLLKRSRRFYWKGLNLLWISDLMYRMRDNARMFFLVSIISSVTFTATSYLLVSTANEFTEKDAVYDMEFYSYPDNVKESDQLQYMEQQLAEHNIQYRPYFFDVFEVRYERNAIENPPVMVMTQKQIASMLPGWKQVQLNNQEALYMRSKHEAVKDIPTQLQLKDTGVSFHLKSIENPVVATSGILIVNENAYEQLKQRGQPRKFYGFQVANWKDTLEISNRIHDEVYGNYSNVNSHFYSKAIQYFERVQTPNLGLFIGLFIAVIFFFAAGSFLYFRLFTDLHEERQKYKALAKIGLSENEMSSSATLQMAVLFFLPLLLAVVNTAFALRVIERESGHEVITQGVITIVGFFMLQLLFFLAVRFNYVKHLKKYVYR